MSAKILLIAINKKSYGLGVRGQWNSDKNAVHIIYYGHIPDFYAPFFVTRLEWM